MTYTITANPNFNSLEVKFEGKPSEAVREALKSLRFRWHGVKKVWYGYKTEEEVKAAISQAETIPEEPETYELTATEAYMGGVGFVGSNAGRHLYGAELSQAIRDAIKKDGIKGVTVSKDSYSMGQSITVTVTVTDADIVTVDELVSRTDLRDFASAGWINDTDDGEKVVNLDEALFTWDQGKIARVHRKLAEKEIEHIKNSRHTMINNYCIDSYKLFTPAFIAKLHRVTLIAQSFNYDDSNSMVDYFDTHFYYSLYVKYSAK